jgi:pimeloyl-ACP methyl ester carboxylesterase
MRLNLAAAICLFSLATLWASPSGAANMAAGAPGSFVYTPPGYFADKPVAVYYYRPKSAGADAEVLFAMHGAERDGKLTRDHWIGAADKLGFVVVAPEFDEDHYPTALYQNAGMGNADAAERTSRIIEGLFDKVRTEEGLAAQTYKMFGHSAGGQFAHRMFLQGEHGRASIVVAANSGTYTMPYYPPASSGWRYPMVLTRDALPPDALGRAFARRLVVLLGSDDVETSGKNVPSGREALAQGANRLERGRKFCAVSERMAAELQAKYNWVCGVVPGVGHNSRKMAKAALEFLFPAQQ